MAAPAALPFRATVCIKSGAGKPRAIGSVREAAEVLRDWPAERRGSAYQNAWEAALAALGGTLEPTTARKAFIIAAKEAGIFVREGR